jgi:hypothetical protein
MNSAQCKLCTQVFSSKQILDQHLNKKNKCNVKTEYKCKMCKKYFKSNFNLKRHEENNTCNINNKVNKTEQMFIPNEKTIKEILENNENDKLFFLKTIGLTMSDEEINKIINSNLTIDTKIAIISCKINKSNSITNINSNNTTNNILVHNFGNEKIDYLSNDYYTKLLKYNYGKDTFLKLSNEIYLNKDKPENSTIKINNVNNKLCKIKKDDKWITTTKDDALKNIFNKIAEIISMIMDDDDIKTKVSDKKLKIIDDYLEKDFEDEIIKEAIRDFILNIYDYTIENE